MYLACLDISNPFQCPTPTFPGIITVGADDVINTIADTDLSVVELFGNGTMAVADVTSGNKTKDKLVYFSYNMYRNTYSNPFLFFCALQPASMAIFGGLMNGRGICL